jgi:hypothetical protein
MNAACRARIRFFADHAGYCTPPGRMVCAKSLADAETFREWAEARGTLSIEWVDDDLEYLGDDPSNLAKIADGTYVVLGCVVRYQRPLGPLAGTAEAIESLWGIVVESLHDPYCRVIEAELCSELLA